ncbi:YceG family protein [Clostridium botulinum]|uniref:Putative component of 'biosynthetic module' domain-containing protein n=1 Tax=Clostridium botulinum C/D str. DC5 TaxID=1443128 RepID=A0A0A0IAV5_CLOBO|nr:YceG family protein [Clostridium botulinum]KGM98584.1 hypothetical protein Z955_10955 [Clostridium botulinum C/D str. DC5]KOC56766.1 hypothetical protein ADU89_02010 [Clostridium botulinum]KOC57001.1 hypothetical protein ADU90_07050 [Clostridium botulinum]MCD3234891.1 hypothetical protein [Clostridium botulinum D/C]MCD3240740.1 hypothetical protein [Clostridium botulinum D/C]
MININKFLNSYPKSSKNILDDLNTPLNKRTGFINGKSPITPIYFYRCIGLLSNETDYYTNIKNINKSLAFLEDSYLTFLSTISAKNNPQITNIFQSLWINYKLQDFDYKNTKVLIKIFKENKLLPMLNSNLLNSSLEESLNFILELYIKKESSVTMTKLKNFSIKLVLWINEFVPKLFKNFNISSKPINNIINPKILYIGNIKKHEVYFLIFLSKLGCDILYVNSPDDGDFSIIDKDEIYSKTLNLNNKTSLDIGKVNTLIKTNPINTNYENLTIPSFDLEKYVNTSIKSSLKTSKNIFKDICSSLNERTDFLGGDSPYIPCYFYRYIGSLENKVEYFNSLFKFDKHLQNFNSLYLNFFDDIPIENNLELITKTANIWTNISKSQTDFKSPSALPWLMDLLITNNAFPDLRELVINSSIINSFYTTLELYITNETNLNFSKIKNFILKILIWIYKYVPDLYKKFDYLKNTTNTTYNPKILYYGNLKKHEAYFLIFLSLMGSDIIYINSKDDTVFEKIDKNNDFSNIINLGNSIDIKPFPKEELITRHETVAFQASSEIEKVLYNTKDGLFKPWQFENYNITPSTLKTTYDELKLLWNEECRIRPGFNIENNTVYIPNLFAKISGVHRDINIYWNELKKLKSTKNTLFIYDIPYTKDSYSNYDLYSLDYCFKDGLVNKENLLKHRLYKFSYLKTSLQSVIIDKINLLLKLNIFNTPIDTELKLKILITILNLDNSILELIQKFDYPFEIPKILIYHNNNNVPSTEDSIILAFLNLMCFDIAIFTPTGYNDIECNISEHCYDIYKLEEVKFNLNIPNLNSIRKFKDRSTSFWSNLFK